MGAFSWTALAEISVHSHTATHIRTLQHTFTCYNTHSHGAKHISQTAHALQHPFHELQHTFLTLQHAVIYKYLHTATHIHTLQRTFAVHCVLLQCVAVWEFEFEFKSDFKFEYVPYLVWIQGTCTLQHTATHCNTLQHTATHCNTLQHMCTLSWTVVCIPGACVVQAPSVRGHAIKNASPTFLFGKPPLSLTALWCVAVCSVCCSVLQCVAVCCSV